MIRAEIKEKNALVEVNGTTKELMLELTSIMTCLLDKSTFGVDDLAYMVAVAIKSKEQIDRGNILRESFVDKLFE